MRRHIPDPPDGLVRDEILEAMIEIDRRRNGNAYDAMPIVILTWSLAQCSTTSMERFCDRYNMEVLFWRGVVENLGKEVENLRTVGELYPLISEEYWNILGVANGNEDADLEQALAFCHALFDQLMLADQNLRRGLAA